MSTYDKIAWLPLCGGLTGLGLILSYLVMRRRGLKSGMRWAAFSLLPLAAYLTGSIQMFWKMGAAVGDFAKGFAFSAEVWAGIAVAGLAFVLFVSSGGRLRRSRDHDEKRGQDTRSVGATTGAAAPGREVTARTAAAASTAPAKAPAKVRKGSSPAGDDDDLGDVEDILRRHGIT
jgi:hypothetical protein